MFIAFWSPYHGQTGTTTTALAMASMTAMVNNYKVLLGHSHFQRSTLERCLIPKRQENDEGISEFSDNGLDALRRLAKNGRLLPEKVSDYTTPLLAGNRLDLLQGLEDTNDMDSKEEINILRRIFSRSKAVYDLVMIDVHSGSSQQLTRMLLEDADVVVVCLNQNRWLLEDYFNNESNGELLAGKRVIHHISSYNRNSKYTVRNIRKLYGLDRVIATPYSSDLMDACNSGKVLDFFMRHLGSTGKDRFYPMMKLLSESMETLLGSIGQIEEAGV